jgi:hypothetical protein
MEYTGQVVIPGDEQPQPLRLNLDAEGRIVSLHLEGFETTIRDVQIASRLKYTEAVFVTSGLPKEDVRLTWKFNAGYGGGSLAGVIIAQPNPHRITGEKGFVLERA